MNQVYDMENKVSDTQPKNTEEIIDEIQNIALLEKSKVSEETIGDNGIHQSILDTKLADHDGDENENTLLNTRSETFYTDAQQYWKSIEPTVDGMLGGFSNINFTDIRGSQDFIKEVFKMKPSPNKNMALDCGAGMDLHLLITDLSLKLLLNF